MLQQEEGQDFAIATGVAHSIRDLLDVAFREIGVNDWAPFVELNERYLRPAEVHHLIGDASKARTVLGWRPTVGFEELIRMMVQSDLAEQELLLVRQHVYR